MIPLGILASANVPAAGSSITVTHLSNHSDATSNRTVFTFSSVSLGDPVAKTILLAIGKRVAAAGTTLSVTVAGYSATIDAKNGTNTAAGIARVDLPSGISSGDIVVTVDTTGALWLSAYVTYDAIAVLDSDAVYDATLTTAETLARTVDTAAGGFALAAAATASGSSPSWTWTGLTERFDDPSHAGAGTTADLETSGGPLSITAQVSVDGLYAGLSVVTYEAA